MQLLVGLRDAWKCIAVGLEDGCTPCIGGTPLTECNIEPALWFKVLALECVCVDCSQHVISWGVARPPDSGPDGSRPADPGSQDGEVLYSEAFHQTVHRSITISTATHDTTINSNGTASPATPSPPDTSSLTHHSSHPPVASLFPSLPSHSSSSPPAPGCQRHHSNSHALMAPHDAAVSLYQDDLQNLFDLAEALFMVNPSCHMNARGQEVEQRSWLRLLHCFLLPLISLHREDVPATEAALARHTLSLQSIDHRILENTSAIVEVKHELAALREAILPEVRTWAEHKMCHAPFLSTFSADLRDIEEDARNMIHTALQNLQLCHKTGVSVPRDRMVRLQREQRLGEQILLDTLGLREVLERSLVLVGSGVEEGVWRGEGEGGRLQESFLSRHRELTTLRETAAQLSKKKVLALSVREALQQTLVSLRAGQSTTGMDVGLHGGHSTDVLPEASRYTVSDEYLTLRDKVHKLLHLHSSPSSQLHHTFCSKLRHEFLRQRDEHFVVISTSPGSASPGLPGPASTLPSSGLPDSASPGSGLPDSTPDPTSPGSTLPGSTSPNSASPSSALPGSTSPNSTSPSSALPGSASPNSASPDSTLPGSASPNSALPGSADVPKAFSTMSYMPTTICHDNNNRRQPRSATLPSSLSSPARIERDLLPTPCPLDPRFLTGFIREHFKHVVDVICSHFNDHDLDFTQRVWLCYERLFFEAFSSDFLPLYHSEHSKFCEKLRLNSLGASLLEPASLELGIGDGYHLSIFAPRTFAEACRLYREITESDHLTPPPGVESVGSQGVCQAMFGGVTSDLSAVSHVISPLEKLQLLTSAFRKMMAATAQLRGQTREEEGEGEESESGLGEGEQDGRGVRRASLVGVSCDDLLPLLVLLLLQLHPALLSSLYLNCCLLEDYIAPFLASGWHGYSLAAFRSALCILSDL